MTDGAGTNPLHPVEAAALAEFDARYPGLSLPPLVVVVPAYNEEETVGAVARSVPAELAGLTTAVIVVDDGSADATSNRAEEAGAYVCRLPENRGQGAALRTGYRVVSAHGGRFVATLDADGQWDAADLEAVAEPVVSGRADLVSGTRRHAADAERVSIRGAGVVVFAALIRMLTGATVTDPANGLRVMTVDVASGVQLDQRQFQAAELLVSALLRSARYAEVPVAHHRRSSGTSKKGGSLRYGLAFTGVVLRTWRRERRRQRAGLL